ncbi:MAG: acetate--CoA ligase [bacterium]
MSLPRIPKDSAKLKVPPNLRDYAGEASAFSWERAAEALEGLPGGGLNIAHEAVDRHVGAGKGAREAIRFLRKDGSVDVRSYQDLFEGSNRFANLLRDLGLRKGEKVFALLGRVPELYLTALGALKNACVFCPLFSAFGPEPIQTRLSLGAGRVLVTSVALYRRKVAAIRKNLPGLEFVILVDDEEGIPDTISWKEALARSSAEFTIPSTAPEDIALLHFTSGTTGRPKGAIHVHQAILAHHVTGRLALDFHEGDVFWCTADPGWVTGTSYGILSPLSNGVTLVVDEEEFDAERWYRTLEEQKVSVWYTAPTAVRMMMKGGKEPLRGRDLSRLRFIASVGEPLNPEAVFWGQEAFGLPIHDNWWQTETGGIMIANFSAMDIKPGSMGRPLPGIEAAIVRRTEEGELKFLPDGEEGDLALRKGWPSMFRGYLHEEERYRKCFAGDWYITGDLAKRDAEGYYWFLGRADDMIKSAGHLIGPFEVESALMEHPAVAEAGVIGKPDPVVREVVKAFVSLKRGFEPSETLRKELLGFARTRLGAAVAPKEIDFLKSLPRTRSGKIMRRLLKARELGLPEGDTSTLEEGS